MRSKNAPPTSHSAHRVPSHSRTHSSIQKPKAPKIKSTGVISSSPAKTKARHLRAASTELSIATRVNPSRTYTDMQRDRTRKSAGRKPPTVALVSAHGSTPGSAKSLRASRCMPPQHEEVVCHHARSLSVSRFTFSSGSGRGFRPNLNPRRSGKMQNPRCPPRCWGVSSNEYCWRIRLGCPRSGIPTFQGPQLAQTPADRSPTRIRQQYRLLSQGHSSGLTQPGRLRRVREVAP